MASCSAATGATSIAARSSAVTAPGQPQREEVLLRAERASARRTAVGCASGTTIRSSPRGSSFRTILSRVAPRPRPARRAATRSASRFSANSSGSALSAGASRSSASLGQRLGRERRERACRPRRGRAAPPRTPAGAEAVGERPRREPRERARVARPRAREAARHVGGEAERLERQPRERLRRLAGRDGHDGARRVPRERARRPAAVGDRRARRVPHLGRDRDGAPRERLLALRPPCLARIARARRGLASRRERRGSRTRLLLGRERRGRRTSVPRPPGDAQCERGFAAVLISSSRARAGAQASRCEAVREPSTPPLKSPEPRARGIRSPESQPERGSRTRLPRSEHRGSGGSRAPRASGRGSPGKKMRGARVEEQHVGWRHLDRGRDPEERLGEGAERSEVRRRVERDGDEPAARGERLRGRGARAHPLGPRGAVALRDPSLRDDRERAIRGRPRLPAAAHALQRQVRDVQRHHADAGAVTPHGGLPRPPVARRATIRSPFDGELEPAAAGTRSPLARREPEPHGAPALRRRLQPARDGVRPASARGTGTSMATAAKAPEARSASAAHRAAASSGGVRPAPAAGPRAAGRTTSSRASSTPRAAAAGG